MVTYAFHNKMDSYPPGIPASIPIEVETNY